MRNFRQVAVFFLTFLAGLGVGLLVAWVIAPVEYVDATPALLRADYKDQYRLLVASAYAANGNLERARSRLSLLEEPDPVQVLTAQAQRSLAAGQPWESVRLLAALASALQNTSPAAFSPSPTLASLALPQGGTLAVLPTPRPDSPSSAETSSPAFLTATQVSTLVIPPTPRPTRTPTVTPGALFALTRQDVICNPALPDGLLQITVLDVARKPVAGIEITITWNGGEEHFFTGLKPDVGNGYADFIMAPDVIYTLRLVPGGTLVSDLAAPICPTEGGETYLGGLRLEFQQP
jgi:hypothetical protein